MRLSIVITCALLCATGCSNKTTTCSLTDASSCGGGQVCADVAGQPVCVAPLVVRGKVLDRSGAPIAGALVSALDGNDAPTSGTATSDASGAYELAVSAARMAGGAPAPSSVKLRAAASGFATFPSGLRPSLPIALSTAMMASGKLVVQTSATDVTLDPVADIAALGSIGGSVHAGAGQSGALVVAEGPATLTAVADIDGAYVIFNAPAGTYTVRGYAAGLQLAPAMAMVTAGHRASPVDLEPARTPLGSVSGSVQIVNAPGGSLTSVVLVVESTFDETWARGEAAPGLRAPRSGPPSISGAFTISDVPDGKYVVLAAFENDGLVRDPDTAIGGTQIQHVSVSGGPVTLSASFKITEALAVVSPGAGDVPDEVSGVPMFVWADDSGEDHYTLELFDDKGSMVWQNPMVPGVNGNANVSATYGGPQLVSGSYYQFRATSISKSGVALSRTEDLRGIFVAH